MEVLFSTVIQSMPPWSRSVAIAVQLTMPRSPTITSCVMPKSSLLRVISGMNLVWSAALPAVDNPLGVGAWPVFPSCTVTATGHPRSSVMSP